MTGRLRIAALLAVLPISNVRGESGYFTGRVFDADSQARIHMANVVVLGTTKGGMSRHGGIFVIRDIQPGTYAIKALQVGYTESVLDSIRIEPDRATVADFYLTKVPIGSDPRVSSGSSGAREDTKERTVVGSVLLYERSNAGLEFCVATASGEPYWFAFAADGRQRSVKVMHTRRTIGVGGWFKDEINNSYQHSDDLARDREVMAIANSLTLSQRVKLKLIGYHIVDMLRLAD